MTLTDEQVQEQEKHYRASLKADFENHLLPNERVPQCYRLGYLAGLSAQPAPCGEYVAVRADAVEWLKNHYPALCEKSGMCERVAGRLYTRTTLSAQPAKPAITEERVIELAKQAGLLSWTNRETLTKFAALLAAEGKVK